jgi:hypothetical protein
VAEIRRRDSDPPLPTGWKRPFVRFYQRNGTRGVVIATIVAVGLIGVGVYSAITFATAGSRIGATSGKYSTLVPHGWDFKLTCRDAPVSLPDDSRAIDGPEDITCLRPDRGAQAGVYLDMVAVDQSAAPTLAQLADSIAKGLSGYSPCDPPKTSTESGPTEVVCLHRSGTTEAGVLRVRIIGTRALVEVCTRTDEPQIAADCVNVWREVQVAG